jgi:signal transduction histidine kinase
VGLHPRLSQLVFRPHLPRRTVRLSLTLLYGCLFLLSGAGLLAVTYLLVHNALAGPIHAPGGSLPRNAGGGIVHAPADSSLLAQQAADLHQLLVQSAIALAIMAVVSIGLGWLVAGRVLQPLRVMTATTRRISERSLHERLAVGGPDDELKGLGDTIDELLARLEAAFDSQRRFVANASHELRTPLTLDRALLERALRNREPTQAFWRATCERLLASSQQQDRLIEALLTLARSEGAISRHEPFELGHVIDSVLLSPELDVASMGLQVQTDIGEAPVNGDPRLVERLVRNLVDNAIRYNQPFGRVDIAAATLTGHAILVVANTGPAIPAADIDRLFQPFQRLAPNRSSHTDGTGLGLSIAKAIADAHDATITATPQPHGGLKIQVSFPACPEREKSVREVATGTRHSAAQVS